MSNILMTKKIIVCIIAALCIHGCGGGNNEDSNNNGSIDNNAYVDKNSRQNINNSNANANSIASYITPIINEEQQTHLALLNQFRKENGIEALALNNKLIKSAQAYAENMLKTGRFDHVAADGSDFIIRITDTGYTYLSLGENIALGQKDVHSVLAAWKASQTHKENMLKVNFTEVGFGHAGNYWVQHFGAPAVK